MDRLEYLRQVVAETTDSIKSIHEAAVVDGEARSLTEAEDADFDYLVNVRAACVAEGIQLEKRAEALAAVIPEATREAGDDRGAPVLHTRKDPWSDEFVRDHGPREAAKRAIDQMAGLDERGQTAAEDKLKQAGRPEMRDGGVGFEQFLLAHSSEVYARGFMKMANGRQYEITPQEADALARSRRQMEARAMSIGTTTAGGFMIPTILDPSVIWTTDGATNPFRAISNVKSVMTNTWTGVTSAGITMSWDTEGAEVSDDTPTFAQPSITCYKLQGFVPISTEAYEDIVGIASEVVAEFAQARDEKEAAAFATGSGSGEPVGIVTALTGVSGSWTNMATNSAISAADLTKIRRNTGPRYRGNASWVMNQAYNDAIRALGTSGSLYSETVALPELAVDRLLGRPVYESSAMTDALNTTTNNAIVYGDFRNYVIASRLGTVVEFIPHMFHTGNNRPSGHRGWVTWSRVGADSVNDAAFTLGVNVNTAFTG